jgi:hypothetical protein
MLRKRLPEHLLGPEAAFRSVVETLEPAKAGLTDVLPTTRLPGRPLRHAVAEYRDRCVAAEPLMPSWRCDELETEWQACERGLREAAGRADHLLAVEDDPIGFEDLLGTVERLLDPLDPFADAAERFRVLRRRVRRTD